MAGKYVSRYSGAEIDEAVMRALSFDPNANGWIRLSSSVDVPVKLNELTSSGNFITDYFIGGTLEMQKYSPINISVTVIDGVTTQSVIILDNVYYRTLNDELYTYNEWFVKKTTNYIYVDEYPETPIKNAIAIVPDGESKYVMKYYNGTSYVDVSTPDTMLGRTYDTQNRKTDIFQYVDDTFQLMSSSSLGIVWNDNDLTSLFSGELINHRHDATGTVCVTIKNSSKLGRITKDAVDVINLPVVIGSPTLVGRKNVSVYELYILDKTLGKIYYSSNMNTWTEINISALNIISFIGEYVGELVEVAACVAYAKTAANSIIKISLANGTVTTNTVFAEDVSDSDFVDGFGNIYSRYSGITGLGTMCVSSTTDITAKIVRLLEASKVVTKLVITLNETQEKFEHQLPDSERYSSISNFVDVFGDYAGYIVSSTGKVFSVQTMSGTFSVTQLYSADPFIKWMGIFYGIDHLQLFGYSTDVFSVHSLLTIQDANLLDGVESHISNGDIHFTQLDRVTLNTKESRENVEVKFNRITTHNKNYIDDTIAATAQEAALIHNEFNEIEAAFVTHIEDNVKHPNQSEKDYWNAKSNPDHTHFNNGTVKINASQVVSGKLSMDRIPNGAKELLYKVLTINDRNNLTIAQVQNGDRIHVADAGIYEVVDETKLAHNDLVDGAEILIPAEDSAFLEAAAGSGVFIDWANVENKPSTLGGYNITDAYTKTETVDIVNAKVAETQDTLETRFLSYNLDELYATANATKINVNTILSEMDAAIAISDDVNLQFGKITDQNQRITEYGMKLAESQAIVTNLLGLYS